MAKAVIRYDRDLPEIRGRQPWEPPASYLVKDAAAPAGWREDKSGRRPSRLLLVPKIRDAVDDWRDSGYRGASGITRRLLQYWFEEDHEISGFDVPFRYYFCQREAIETLIWLVEIAGQRDAKALVEAYGPIARHDLASDPVVFQTTMEGKRQLRRYVPELEAEGVQDLPPEKLRRFAFKMATGSGKTWVMAMAIVWSRLHKQNVSGSELSTNFLVVAPNVIVYQRLEKDFANNRIFHQLPLIPPEWQAGFSQKVILRGDAANPNPSGNLFLTNIHHLYESTEKEWTPENAVDALLGKKPSQDLASSAQRSMLERVKSLKDLLMLNDEAHHVHDDALAWSKSLLAIQEALPCGLGAWLDFSATPKDQNGMYFPWTVVDYPLAQAAEEPIIIESVQERLEYDVAIPITKPSLRHDHRKLSDLDVQSLEPIYEQEELDEPFRIKLKMVFATLETEVGQDDIRDDPLPVHELPADLTNQVAGEAGPTNRFAELYPIMRECVENRCFGREVDMDDDALRSHLARLEMREGIAKYLVRKIAGLTVERREIEFDKEDFRLS